MKWLQCEVAVDSGRNWEFVPDQIMQWSLNYHMEMLWRCNSCYVFLTLRNSTNNDCSKSSTTNLCAAVSDCDESEGAWLQLRIHLSYSQGSSLAVVWAEQRESGGSYGSPCGPVGGPASRGKRARLRPGGASWGRSWHLGRRDQQKQPEAPWDITSIFLSFKSNYIT